MRRITPEEVLDAYRNKGLRPVTGTFYCSIGAVGCACALGALVNFHARYDTTTDICKRLGLEYNYGAGFVDAFDGSVISSALICPDAYALGHKDGAAVRKVVENSYGEFAGR